MGQSVKNKRIPALFPLVPCQSPAEILIPAQSVRRELSVVGSLCFALILLADLTLCNALTQTMCVVLNRRLVPVGVASVSSFTILPRTSVRCSPMEDAAGMITDSTHDQNAFQHVVSYKSFNLVTFAIHLMCYLNHSMST